MTTVVKVVWILCTIGILEVAGQVYTQPEQVHLAYGNSPHEMVVTWVTFDPTHLSVVEYGRSKMSMASKGNYTKFTDGGSEKRILYIHRVTLANLTPGEKYVYHCGSPDGWSDVFTFTSMPEGNDWRPRLVLFGDMGNKNPQSLGRMQEEVENGKVDAILHVGDLAYNLDTDNARVGDAFMRQVESIASYVPYMTVVGNHEAAYNFSNYINRFSMPGEDDHRNLWYSFNMGPAHIIGFSTEVFFFPEYYGDQQIYSQFRWLMNDLTEANLPENRSKRPWIITMGHKPMYCSNTLTKACDNKSPKSVVSVMRKNLEWLFYKYGVDLELWGHMHDYERLWPVYNLTVCNGSREEPYTNPKAPVHIITGSAGCQEDHSVFTKEKPDWSAFRALDYGYTRMTIHNHTHMYLEQVSDDQGGKVIDTLWIIQNKHAAGMYDCVPGES